ncbi:right-handed parallel beta-helix repeat-containing protein [Yoonia sp. F2084L]|uniref:NosD domain-containing protein n=1 Tax=Yoonia sp. F2084L TaxID=2926419 RepID=UPI001FF5CBFF|nr:NosD domain-containing protein [Yoonia sp. F2084L]MCK0096008.1 right-handed parallel beta-helix repeat-containing protein [Yoonia sp. F2084L]
MRKAVWHMWLVAAILGSPASADGLERFQALELAADDLYPSLVERAVGGGDPAEMIADAQGLLDDVASDAQPLPPAVSFGAGTVQLIDLRIALVQLAISAGANDQLSVVRAQSSEAPQVIAVQDGQRSLTDIRRWLATQPEARGMMNGDVLRAPLVVLPGGALVLERGDTLLLSRSDGAFLANFGALFIDGATVAGTPEINPQVPMFAPFVTTAGTGMARVSDAKISALGFGETALFSGFSISNRGLYAAIGPSFIRDSVLQDGGDLTLIGTTGAVVESNLFATTTQSDLALRAAKQSHVSGNLFLSSGLRITDRSDDTHVAGNVVMAATRAGITVDRASVNTVITGNFVWDSAKAGITVADSDCAFVTRNIAIGNGQKGAIIRASRQSDVVENAFLGNRSTGLFVGDQVSGTDTVVAQNVFVGNRTGLASSSADRLLLAGNDFSQQFPRFLGGDIVRQADQIIGDLQGAQEIEIAAGAVESFRAEPVTCLWDGDN